MKIRKAQKKDLNKLIKLEKESHKEITWWSPLNLSEFQKLIRKRLVYVTEDKKEIIAYLNGNVKDNQLFLEDIYVKKEFRNNGIGKKLIKFFLADWKKSKFKEVRLDCPERLRKFYEKFGFKTTALIMKKKLK